MASFNLESNHSVQPILGVLYHVIHVRISSSDSKFPIKSSEEYLTVKDLGANVKPFDLRIARNQKEVDALFTIDAFSVFSGNVTIEFGYGGNVFTSFQDVDINTITTPLPPILIALPSIDADNAWLASL